MRWIWSGVMFTGMLLVLWGVVEAQKTPTTNPIHYSEDGAGFPPFPITKP